MVRGAVPGDVINFVFRKKRNGMKWGTPDSWVEKSPHRIEAKCEHFQHCGGCSWQELDYAEQAQQKHNHVEQALRRLGGIQDAEYRNIIGGEKIYEYRNKMTYSFSRKRWLTLEEIRSGEEFNEPGLGFYAQGSFDKVINVTKCHLQSEPSNEIRNHLRTWAIDNGFTFYDAKSHVGDLRNLILRTTRQGEIMAMLVVGNDSEELKESFVAEMEKRFPQIEHLVWMVNTKWNDSLHDLDFSVLKGSGYITESLDGTKFRIGPKSFFQTNPGQAEHLFRAVRDMAEFQGKENLYDLYCGVGSIGIYMAQFVQRLVGIEEIPEAIDDARINAQINTIENANFEVGDVRVLMDEDFIRKYKKPDVIITDPPRAGMHEDVVKTLNRNPVEKMVYVSCNPATQARDLKRLNEVYETTVVQPVDMFPQTNHVESIALLKMRK